MFSLLQVKNHRDNLTSIAISKPIGKAASCGDNTVKVHELHDLKETSNVINIDDERGLDNIEWSEDGQLLAVSTSKGIHIWSLTLDYCVMDGECALENAPKTRVFDCQCTTNEVSGALTIKHECRGRIFKCT